MSLAVVDLSGLKDGDDDESKKDSKDEEIDVEDELWRELIGILERLAKGVEGDVSALNRAVRSMNRFRGRMTDYTWGRLMYFLVPAEERANLITLLRVTTADGWEAVRASVVAKMTSHSIEEAQKYLSDNQDSVLDAVLAAVKSKEDLAVQQLVKEAKEAEEREAAELAEARLKQERLLKGSSTLSGTKGASASSSSSASSSYGSSSEKSSTGDESSKKKKGGSDTADEKLSDYDITVSFLKEGSTRPKGAGGKGAGAASSKKTADDSSSSSSSAVSGKDSSSTSKSSAKSSAKSRRKERRFYDETRVYLLLLIAYRYFDADNHADALKIVENVLAFCHETNRRSLDLLCGRALSLFSLCHQRQSESSSMNNNSSTQLRSRLFAEYKRAQLEQNEMGQCIAINLILHNLIMCDNPLYSMASKFSKNSGFLTEAADSTSMARNHYYNGRIATVELDYESALYHLQHALRRAPQTGALGFKLSCVKWLATVNLLRGDIPEHSLLNNYAKLNDRSRRELNPYIEVTQAVRNGELKKFTSTLEAYSAIFRKDGLSAILLRLKQNVIKTGLRKISKSYSRISLFDISKKLGLESAKEAHLIVAKAICDGVITDCVIDFDKGELSTKETPDIYKSRVPYTELSKRIDFCLDIHTTAVKALRYPQKDDEDEDEQKENNDDEEVDVEEIVEAIREAMEEDD